MLSYATALPPAVLVGFTGGTGGENDVHAVQNVTIIATSSGFRLPSSPASARPWARRRRHGSHDHRDRFHWDDGRELWRDGGYLHGLNTTPISATSPVRNRYGGRDRHHARGGTCLNAALTITPTSPAPPSPSSARRLARLPEATRSPSPGPTSSTSRGSTSARRTRRRHSTSSTRPPSLPQLQTAGFVLST